MTSFSDCRPASLTNWFLTILLPHCGSITRAFESVTRKVSVPIWHDRSQFESLRDTFIQLVRVKEMHINVKKKIQLWNCAPLLKTDTGFDILHLEELFCERHLFSIYCSDFCQKTSRKTHVPKNWLFLNLRPSNCSNTSLSVWTTPTYKTHNVCTSVNATVTSLTNLNCATSLWIFSAHIKILLFHNIMI